MINVRAVQSRHQAAVEVGRKLQNRSLESGDHNALFASCSDVPELLDHIEKLRTFIANELEVFATQCLSMADLVEQQMTSCAKEHNRAIIEVYRQAANIARVGQSYRNHNCKKCHDTRGGLMDHRTEECTWSPPDGFFEEKEQCIGRDLIQVGWMGPYGIVPGGMDVTTPVPSHWRPIYMKKVEARGAPAVQG